MSRWLAPITGLFCLVAWPACGYDRPEFRAVWITRFEWADEDPETCRSNIIRALDSAASANLNAVLFQIRGKAETLYPSPLEPWSELLGGKDPGFDLVALALGEAHKRGLQFHAYINPMPLRSLRSRRPPADPDHLWHRHGPGSAEPWVCLDAQGRPAREEYYYLSPGVPEVQAYLRRVILDVVTRYDVDGIHLDRMRFPGPDYIHDPVSERRFRGRGNPALRERADWQREQLDKFINDLAVEIRAVRPGCALSCSAWGIYNRHNISGYEDFSSGYHDYYQDTWNWCRIGAMDYLMPMIYWDMADPRPNYDEVLRDFAEGVGREHLVGGQRVFWPDENEAQVRAGRQIGIAGSVLFSLRGAERRGVLARLKQTLYSRPAEVPQVERLREPTAGCILGTVTTKAGRPLADAWVSLVPGPNAGSGRGGATARTWTSSADGRFAFLDVPPGTVRVRAHYVGAEPVESEPVTVRAGEVARVEVTIPGGELACERPFLQILAPADGHTTTSEVVHILGRTSPECRVRVGGTSVEVYATGAFAADGVPLAEGENRVSIEATDVRGVACTEELLVIRRWPASTAEGAQVRGDNRAFREAPEEPDGGVCETSRDNVGLTFGLHTVRLGGPYVGRVPSGTRLEIIGRRGRNLRVALSRSLSAWVEEDQVSRLPAGTAVPHNYFTSCDVDGDDRYDRIAIGLREKVAFAIRSETDPDNRLYLDFFNTHHALTWISHKSGARVIGPVTAEQVEDGWLRLTVPLRCRQIWGYWAEVTGDRLTVFIRRPPPISDGPHSPLKGLLFALEAGHGGSGTGAVGPMGTKEKTVNATAVRELQHVLERRGARTVLVRPGDSSPTLEERVERTNAAGADFFVSIHANAAGHARGYLSVSGTSTYYRDKHCHRPAECVYRRLLQLGWQEFGVVGNFSYYPLQNTRVPGILVEQAFLSNPSDEARLLDAEYQRRQAEAIADGLEDFFAAVRE